MNYENLDDYWKSFIRCLLLNVVWSLRVLFLWSHSEKNGQIHYPQVFHYRLKSWLYVAIYNKIFKMGLKWKYFLRSSHLCSWLIFRASYLSEKSNWYCWQMKFCILFNKEIHLENKRPVNGIHYMKNQVERPLSHKISNFIILSLLQVMVNRDWIDVFSQY